VTCSINCYWECHYTERHYAECPYAEGHYAECHYADCHYAECRGTLQTDGVAFNDEEVLRLELFKCQTDGSSSNQAERQF